MVLDLKASGGNPAALMEVRVDVDTSGSES